MKALARWLVVGWLALPGLAVAAPPGLTPSADAPGPGRGPGAGPGAGVEAVKKRIRALRASTLVDELQLDEATAGRLFPIFGRYDDETEKLLKLRADLQKRLRDADAIKDPRAVNQLIDDAMANQRAFWDLEEKRLTEVRKVLSPAQAARLVVVLPALERKIQNQLRKALQAARRKGGQRPARAGRPAWQDDDDDGDEDELPAPARRP